MQRFLITACPRSGTKYTAELLTAAGIPTGHERVYNPTGPHPWRKTGEVSWAAVPHLADIVAQGIPILHQVRHPLKVIASMMAKKLFERPGGWRDIATDFLWGGVIDTNANPLWAASYMWLKWNEEIEKYTYKRYRIEDMSAALLVDVWMDYTEKDSISLDALQTTPRDINHSKGRVKSLEWPDLPADLVEPIREMSSRYGYRS